MRVYVPATLAMLQLMITDGELFPVSGTAFAVTPTLREAYSEGDDEELAEVALREAALGSLRLLATDAVHDDDSDGAAESRVTVDDDARPGQAGDALPPRRAVLVADVADALVKARPDLDDAVVRLSVPVRTSDLVAVYVDIAAAEPAVLAAMTVIDAADLGDEDAELTVGDAQDHDLAWYATQELPFLLELL
ncbi:MAG TPA: hypothetical protein VFW21_05680 [Mycobacterium sp.]|nr:hypothetical protein [Mycobacterium sp.]